MMKRTSFRTVIDDGRFGAVSVSGHLKEDCFLSIKRRDSVTGNAVAAILTDDQVRDLIDALQKYLACEVA
jgi:hypothetical protein